jgi:hypothetical protein
VADQTFKGRENWLGRAGHELETTVESERLVTAGVPDHLFSKPGEYQIYLLDKTRGNKSNSVVFKVE